MQVGVVGGTNTGARFIFYIHTRLPPPSLCQTAHHELIGAEHGVVSAGGENWSCHYLNYQKIFVHLFELRNKL